MVNLQAHSVEDADHDAHHAHVPFPGTHAGAAAAGVPGFTRDDIVRMALAVEEQRSAVPRQPLTSVAEPKASPNLGPSLFQAFAPQVKVRTDAEFLYVESISMPDHRMMVGITAWQQQVPIPQPYSGQNAWRIPLQPVVAAQPLSAKSHFFRGAIALAANGVPIFNPIKNDGRTDTFLAGELDEFGGHCGRADDYHYHIAPTHLQEAVGPGRPIALALDGYPLYGFNEPEGTPPGRLDELNGHSTPSLGYHYHATRAYPYLNGGFHGAVSEREGQVDPQPRAGGVRPALPPWRGAKITGFAPEGTNAFQLTVQSGNGTHRIRYTLNPDGGVTFVFTDAQGKATTETYSPRQRGRDERGGNQPGRRRPRE